jgi:hypothetical protein
VVKALRVRRRKRRQLLHATWRGIRSAVRRPQTPDGLGEVYGLGRVS